MPKLAIYVPKAEMKLIEKWRKRLNYSQIFMKALQEEIRRQRAKKESTRRKSSAAASDVVRAANFYKSRLNQSDESLDELGKRMAREQVLACSIPVDVVQQLVRLCDKDELTRDDMLLIKRQIEHTSLAADARLNDFDTKSEDMEAFSRAYLQGTADTWQEITQHF